MTNFPWPRFDELLEKQNRTPEEQRELDKLNEWIDQEAEKRDQEDWNNWASGQLAGLLPDDPPPFDAAW